MANALVVSYSRSGSCDKVAEWVLDALKADHERIVTTAKYDGIIGWLRGGYHAMRQKTPAIAPPQLDPDRYEKIVLIFPIWAGRIAPPMCSYLLRRSGFMQDVRVITVADGSNGAAAAAAVASEFGATVAGHLSLTSDGLRKDSTWNHVVAFVQAS